MTPDPSVNSPKTILNQSVFERLRGQRLGLDGSAGGLVGWGSGLRGWTGIGRVRQRLGGWVGFRNG